MNAPLIDPFARAITYLRVSVTDRCDFRCVYCMAEHMTFLPKKELLTLEERNPRGYRRMVRTILERDPRVVAYGDPPGEAGGWGATWVRME